MRLAVALSLSIAASPALAQWSEPPRGSDLRSAILSAVRTVAEVDLNPPIEFIVNELRHDGDVAFGALQPQRPGGRAIDWDSTAIAERGEPEEWYDGTTVHAFLERVDGQWTVVDHSIGATDVWWFQSPLCETFKSVIPEYCE